MLVVHFDGQLAPAVKASRAEIDGTDNRALAVSQQHFGVEFQVLELVDLDTDIVENADAAHTLDQFFLFERMGWPGHHVNLYPTLRCSHQALNYDGVLVALVLNEQGVLGAVDEFGDTVAAIVVAPDQAHLLSRIKLFPVTVGLETIDDIFKFVGMRS